MNVYICVYRHTNKPKGLAKVKQNAKQNPLIAEFVSQYFEKGNVLDWGDDPAFFMASKKFSSPAYATWGVCRRNVREKLSPGDLVIFFCGREEEGKHWHYYYIGFGTVKQTLYNREEIWTRPEFEPYRDFFNILVREGEHNEPFGKEHEDWPKRITAPYIFFETGNELTTFNLENPLLVADCDTTQSLLETWHTANPRVALLRDILFEKYAKTDRGLRINNIQRAHAHIRFSLGIEQLIGLRRELRSF